MEEKPSSLTYNVYLQKNKCESVSSCVALNRIATYLDEYQTLPPKDIPKRFNKQNCPTLADDFNHILFAHLGDNSPQRQTQAQYEQIHQYIMDKLKTCKVESCIKFQRNNRQRETHKLSLKSEDEKDVDLESGAEYYIETMDTMHCFFVHSFDIGYRVRISELNNDDDDEKHEDDDENIELHDDKMLIKLSNILRERRVRLENVRGRDVFNQSKFVTVATVETEPSENKNKNNDNDEKKEEKKSKIWELAQKKMKPFYNSQKE
eukprot:226611_1